MKNEVEYENGSKLKFKGLDDSNVRGLRSIVDIYDTPTYEGNEYFIDELCKDNSNKVKQLAKKVDSVSPRWIESDSKGDE